MGPLWPTLEENAVNPMWVRMSHPADGKGEYW